MVTGNVYECTLPVDLRVSVQPGDIIGIEIARRNVYRFMIYFDDTDDGPINYVFEQSLSSAILSQRNSIEQDQPQISLTVVPTITTTQLPTTTQATSITEALTTTQAQTAKETVTTTESPVGTNSDQTTTQMNIPQTTNGRISEITPLVASSSTAVVTGSVVGGVAVVLLLVVIVILLVMFVQQKKQKRYPGSGQSIGIYPYINYGMSIMQIH